MTKVNRSTDCGNSPKNKMVEDIAIALEMSDTNFLSAILDSEAIWNNWDGCETVGESIPGELHGQTKPDVLTIDHVMSHGRVGAVNGHAKRGRTQQRFCHVIEFTSTKYNKIRRVESYRG